MLTSMFRKMLLVYVSVIVVAFASLSFALNLEIKHFLADQRLQVLNGEAQEILPFLERANSTPAAYPAFDRIVSRYKQSDNTSVNVLLLKGGSGLKKIQRLTNRLITHDQILNVSAVQKVLNGGQIQMTGPFSTVDKESVLTVGLPISSNGTVIGALFLHTPIQELQMGQVTQIIFLLAIPILLLSIVILYFTSRRFSRPLIQMNRVVQSIGEGHFEERLKVTSEDEIGQLSRTFNQMAAQLELLENMRKDLIANVSHELRTPLTSVRGFVQGILEGVIPPEQHQQYLEISFKELGRLNTILNTMLDLSAIETGRVTLDCRAICWSSIVSSVIDSLEVRAAEKRINLNVLSTQENVEVWGDPERMKQVVFNVIDNAIRHTDAGEISISSAVMSGQLNVRIADTGEGISPEILPHIWERFFTGAVSRTSHHARSGLGLTITRHLVEMMNGRIDVESMVGVGTTFTLRFPILDRQPEKV